LCRAARILQSNGSSAHGSCSQSWQPRREMFRAMCAECGKGAQLPFEPRYGRRVYCSDCYSKVRPGVGR
jgi:CxxC-x17-CxxC domain-containing protein